MGAGRILNRVWEVGQKVEVISALLMNFIFSPICTIAINFRSASPLYLYNDLSLSSLFSLAIIMSSCLYSEFWFCVGKILSVNKRQRLPSHTPQVSSLTIALRERERESMCMELSFRMCMIIGERIGEWSKSRGRRNSKSDTARKNKNVLCSSSISE